jgi:hippurate hydrolase
MTQIVSDRRALHTIPEVEWDLPMTSEYVKNSLEKLNCQVFSPVDTAVCAFFDFGADHSIGFRADMDALPIEEKTGLPFASTHPGKMHACGHDGHMAIGLELARRLNKKENLPHNVLLIFQPGEESPGGAKRICETGVLEQFGVRTVFGLHLWPALEKGRIFCRAKELMSRAAEVSVDIYGKSSHIGNAAAGIDSTAAAVEFYRLARQAEADFPEGIYRLLNFGRFQSGTVRNALSAHARLEGSLRAFQDEVFDTLQQKLQEAAAAVEAKFGCTVQLTFGDSYPAVMNDPALLERVKKAADFSELEKPSMTAEDFSWYQRYAGGIFFFLGLGDVPALHATNFDFDESVLEKGADFFEKLAEDFR